MRHRLTKKPKAIQPQIRVFVCQTCGVKAIAPKAKRKTYPGHVKDFYCFKCKEITKHTQIE